MSYYMDKINPTPSGMVVECLKGYTKSLSADVVLHALGIALDERKTEWSYIHAILNRYERDRLMTLDAVLLDERKRAEQKAEGMREKPSKVTAQGFQSGEKFQDMGALLAGLEEV